MNSRIKQAAEWHRAGILEKGERCKCRRGLLPEYWDKLPYIGSLACQGCMSFVTTCDEYVVCKHPRAKTKFFPENK